MAEGRNFSRTLEGGSDTLFDHECTQCGADGSKQEATYFCQDCKQLFCKICGRYHIRYMKTHTLVSVMSPKQPKTILPTVSPVPDVAKCQYHPDLDIEMYCGTHDMVYCWRCIAIKHRSCSDVNEIKDVAHKSSLSTLQSLEAKITRVSKQLHTSKLEISNDLKLMQNMKDSLLEEIKGLRRQFNIQLDELEQKIIAELEEERNKLKNEIDEDITAIDDLIIASDKSKPDLTSHFDEKQIFIAEKLGQVVLADASNFLKKTNALKRPKLKFEPNDILRDVMAQSDRIGKINRIETKQKQIQRIKYTKKSMNEINVTVSSDKTACGIKDMCQLPDGSILLIDDQNNKLKRLDDQLYVKDFLDLKAEAAGLCSVSPTEVAVRLYNKTIHFISVGKSLTYQRKVSIKNFNNAAHGMAYCNDQLWIPGARAVYVYSLSGTLIKTIETDSQGLKLFSICNPGHIAVSNDNTNVYVVAGDERVVVFNNNGELIKELRDDRLNVTHGICIIEDAILLVAGWVSKNVVVFDRDGNSLGELVSRKDMLSKPRSLLYDRERCRLLVGYELDRVQIFKLS